MKVDLVQKLLDSIITNRLDCLCYFGESLPITEKYDTIVKFKEIPVFVGSEVTAIILQTIYKCMFKSAHDDDDWFKYIPENLENKYDNEKYTIIRLSEINVPVTYSVKKICELIITKPEYHDRYRELCQSARQEVVNEYVLTPELVTITYI